MPKSARLLFDSAHAGAAIGARGFGGQERSLLFAAGSLSVDMVAFPSEGGLHVVYGQVIDTTRDHPVPGARVNWQDGDDAVKTDPYGQFAVSSLGGSAGRILRIDVGDDVVDCRVPALGRDRA